MKVLAIDPGYGRCGVAILERGVRQEVVIHSDCIETSSKDDFADRLGAVIAECERLINIHQPTSMAIEKLYFNTNQKTAMHVAEVRGALIALAAMRDMTIAEYTPPQIKSAVAGSGRADKKQIQHMVHLLVALPHTIKHDDEYDAIAVGLTHLAFVKHT